MAQNSGPISHMFRIDVSADSNPQPMPLGHDAVIGLLRELTAATQRQNKLLEELVQQNASSQKQRMTELQQWKDANPHLSRACRRAAETLSKVQTRFLENLTVEVCDQEDSLVEGDFILNEFVDRFGPRLAHLNGVLQVLAQLGSSVPAQANSSAS
jgi:hypothetical protein